MAVPQRGRLLIIRLPILSGREAPDAEPSEDRPHPPAHRKRERALSYPECTMCPSPDLQIDGGHSPHGQGYRRKLEMKSAGHGRMPLPATLNSVGICPRLEGPPD